MSMVTHQTGDERECPVVTQKASLVVSELADVATSIGVHFRAQPVSFAIRQTPTYLPPPTNM
jgi:hypothetical protein